MANPAHLLPRNIGSPLHIQVDNALMDELLEDLAERGFEAEEVGVASSDSGPATHTVEVKTRDEASLQAFLRQWNTKEQEG